MSSTKKPPRLFNPEDIERARFSADYARLVEAFVAYELSRARLEGEFGIKTMENDVRRGNVILYGNITLCIPRAELEEFERGGFGPGAPPFARERTTDRPPDALWPSREETDLELSKRLRAELVFKAEYEQDLERTIDASSRGLFGMANVKEPDPPREEDDEREVFGASAKGDKPKER